MGLFTKKPTPQLPRHRPVTTHIIKLLKTPEGKYKPEVLDIDRVNILDKEYDSEKDCRAALVGLRDAFQNGSWRVEVIE